MITQIFSPEKRLPINLHVKGTNFQLQIWRAVLSIPPSRLYSCKAVAFAIGSPKATRAVGNALGSNPVAVLIPCHRVILASGAIGNYHWGVNRKRSLLAWERAAAAS